MSKDSVHAQQSPVIAGVEITTDSQGRFNLNALHKASGLGEEKAPNRWLRTQAAKELIAELQSQTPNMASEGKSKTYDVLKVVNGGSKPGIFGHQLLAISYAGWISPSYQLQVNQVFLDYKTGKLAPRTVLTVNGVDIEIDEAGRYRLNHVLRASGQQDDYTKYPSSWLVTKAARDLATGLGCTCLYEAFNPKHSCGLLHVIHGGAYGGCFANEALMLAYAEWVDPALPMQIKRAMNGEQAPDVPVSHTAPGNTPFSTYKAVADFAMAELGVDRKTALQAMFDSIEQATGCNMSGFKKMLT